MPALLLVAPYDYLIEEVWYRAVHITLILSVLIVCAVKAYARYYIERVNTTSKRAYIAL